MIIDQKRIRYVIRFDAKVSCTKISIMLNQNCKKSPKIHVVGQKALNSKNNSNKKEKH